MSEDNEIIRGKKLLNAFVQKIISLKLSWKLPSIL